MNVRYIKLISGEEIVCEVKEFVESSDIEIFDPLAIMQQLNPANQQLHFTMIPFASEVESPLIIKADKIVFLAKPKEELLKHYQNLKAQKSGIVLPNKPSILLP